MKGGRRPSHPPWRRIRQAVAARPNGFADLRVTTKRPAADGPPACVKLVAAFKRISAQLLAPGVAASPGEQDCGHHVRNPRLQTPFCVWRRRVVVYSPFMAVPKVSNSRVNLALVV